MVNQGFKQDKLTLKYTNNKVLYGEPIFLKISYKYGLDLPFMNEQTIDMEIERNSISKR